MSRRPDPLTVGLVIGSAAVGIAGTAAVGAWFGAGAGWWSGFTTLVVLLALGAAEHRADLWQHERITRQTVASVTRAYDAGYRDATEAARRAAAAQDMHR